MALYDVRRISSTVSSVVNFGARQSSQQLVASYNVPARADEAAAASASMDGPLSSAGNASGGSIQAATASACSSDDRSLDGRRGLTGASQSSLTVSTSARIYPFFSDLQLNPVDCNLVAFVRPDLQVMPGQQQQDPSSQAAVLEMSQPLQCACHTLPSLALHTSSLNCCAYWLWAVA
jgi:hypothetical protein